MAIKSACLLFGGPLLICRAFKHSRPHALWGIAYSEFIEAINSLEQAGLGKVHTIQIQFALNPVTVFIKEQPKCRLAARLLLSKWLLSEEQSKCEQMYLYRYQESFDQCRLNSRRRVPRCLNNYVKLWNFDIQYFSISIHPVVHVKNIYSVCHLWYLTIY